MNILSINVMYAFETGCQWEQLDVQMTTLAFSFRMHKYIYPFVKENFEREDKWTFTWSSMSMAYSWLTGL